MGEQKIRKKSFRENPIRKRDTPEYHMNTSLSLRRPRGRERLMSLIEQLEQRLSREKNEEYPLILN